MGRAKYVQSRPAVRVGIRYNAVDCFHQEKQVGAVTHASSSNLDLFFNLFGRRSGGGRGVGASPRD